MVKPQQPELRRSGLGDTDQEAKEALAREAETPESGGRAGRVPEENRPGHRPEHDQDKPDGPPDSETA